MQWIIYLRYDDNGPDYVGVTTNLKRRLKEHSTALKTKVTAVILEEGTGIEWRRAEYLWIAELITRGVNLKNKMPGGAGRCFPVDETTRIKLSTASKGRKKPVGFGEKLSSRTKGVPHEWTPEGRKNAARTQFKKGQKPTEAATIATSNRLKSEWAKVSSDERSRLITELNLNVWSSRDQHRRSEIGNKIAAVRAKNHTPEELSHIASANAKRAFNNPSAKKRCSSNAKNWWASMTPDEKSVFVAQRAVKIQQAKAAKVLSESAA